MKIWCDKCKGSGVEHYSTFGKKYCSRCNGKGYTEHEGSLEDLECAEIKRRIKDKGITLHIKIAHFAARLDLIEPKKEFFGQDEYEVLQKADKWLEQKGGKE